MLAFYVKNSCIAQMENVDNEFKKIADKDFDISTQSINTPVSTITTREIQQIDAPNTDKFMTVDVPDAYRVDAKPFIERPFYVGSVVFANTAARYSLLTTPIKVLPGDIARSNKSLLYMFKMASYGRPDLVLNISLAGTITHAGCVLAAVLPPMPSYPSSTSVLRLINTALSGPHAFLNANEATSVSLPVPWYCNTDMATLDMETTNLQALDLHPENGNYGTLVFIVLNPLAPSTGSSNSLNIVIEACFKHFDMVVPTPRLVDWVAQARKRKPIGLNNPVYNDELSEMVVKYSDDKKRWFVLPSIPGKYVATAVSIASVLFGLVRLIAAQEDEIKGECIEMKAQSGLISGLFDTLAGGMKKVAGDAIDSLRTGVRDYTGLHNPNDATIKHRIVTTETNFLNNVDMEQYFEKLDPDANFNRITKEPLFGTFMDEMAISNVIQKKQMIGTIKVSTTDGVGKLLWVRPISPFQGGITAFNTPDGFTCANNLELLHSMHRAWRGGMTLSLQSVMNNKQQVKLKVLKFYNPSTHVFTHYPSYASSANAPSHLLEFTQGGQVHEIDLPFLNRNSLQPCTEEPHSEALQHGLYYIYVAQPLVVSDGSPNYVEFNVYLNCNEDFNFYGYAKANTYHANFGLYGSALLNSDVRSADLQIVSFPESRMYWDDEFGTARAVKAIRYTHNLKTDKIMDEKLRSRLVKEKGRIVGYWIERELIKSVWHLNPQQQIREDDDSYQVKVDALMDRLNITKVDREKFINNLVKVNGVVVAFKQVWDSNKTEWKAQAGKTVEVMNKPQLQENNVRDDEDHLDDRFMTRLKPNVDIRPLIRRMYKSATDSNELPPGESYVKTYPLGMFLGELPWAWAYTPIETISRMYYGKNVGFKLRFNVLAPSIDEGEDVEPGIDTLKVRAYYLPQNQGITVGDNTVSASAPNPAAFSPFTAASLNGEVPLTASLVKRGNEINSMVYEFVIPNTSFYKFLGSPQKFRDFASVATPSYLSNLDFGTVMLQIINTSRRKRVIYAVEVFVGLTDESRFGFHCIAPPFTIFKEQYAYYLGDPGNPVGEIPTTLNPNIYLGGFL